MGNARTADFAATAPWSGITGKPDVIGYKPEPHAATHRLTGSDPVELAIAQIVGLAQELASKASASITINGQPLTGNVSITKAMIRVKLHRLCVLLCVTCMVHTAGYWRKVPPWFAPEDWPSKQPRQLNGPTWRLTS